MPICEPLHEMMPRYYDAKSFEELDTVLVLSTVGPSLNAPLLAQPK